MEFEFYLVQEITTSRFDSYLQIDEAMMRMEMDYPEKKYFSFLQIAVLLL